MPASKSILAIAGGVLRTMRTCEVTSSCCSACFPTMLQNHLTSCTSLLHSAGFSAALRFSSEALLQMPGRSKLAFCCRKSCTIVLAFLLVVAMRDKESSFSFACSKQILMTLYVESSLGCSAMDSIAAFLTRFLLGLPILETCQLAQANAAVRLNNVPTRHDRRGIQPTSRTGPGREALAK